MCHADYDWPTGLSGQVLLAFLALLDGSEIKPTLLISRMNESELKTKALRTRTKCHYCSDSMITARSEK